MIRTQQLQLEQMRQYQQEHSARHQSPLATTISGAPASAGAAVNNFAGSTAVVDDSTPTSEQSFSMPSSIPFLPAPQSLSRANRRNSRPRTGSSATSPAVRPLPTHNHHETSHSSHGSGDWPSSPVEIARRNSSRDESAYYQAETANLTRENQMLRLRIRELERQVNELNAHSGAIHVSPNAPVTGSSFSSTTTIEREGAGGGQSHVRLAEGDKE